MVRFLVIGDDATTPDICEAINNLRARQLHAVIPSTGDELADDINEMLEMLFSRLPSRPVLERR